VHSSSVKAQIDVTQNFDGPETFADSAKFNDRRR
jgi:hypothetical protein